MAYIVEKHLFIMGSLTGKFSKGILGDFIFKAAVWSNGCFKSLEYRLLQKFCTGHNETSNGNRKASENFRKSSQPGKIRIFPPPKNSAEALTDLLSKYSGAFNNDKLNYKIKK